jgi:hypothetical protein
MARQHITVAIREYSQRLAAKLERGVRKAVEKDGPLDSAVGEIVPIDTGRMWDTRRVRQEGSGFKTMMVYAFVAPYSPFVHADPARAHGETFNKKYAREIRLGLTHARRPQERFAFLQVPLDDPKVLGDMRKTIVEELNH